MAGMSEALRLDDRIRGVPPGTRDLPLSDVAGQGWRPDGGSMSLPVLTLDEAAFATNSDLMLGYARQHGVAIAPHAKTPMAPDLARRLVEAGAWGATVADLRQAAVMTEAGLGRLILANQVGGRGGARRLAALLRARPEAELYAFLDSLEAAEALDSAWAEHPGQSPLPVLVEVGAARAGARSAAAVETILDAVEASQGRLVLSGVATYEGAAAVADVERTHSIIADLLGLAADALARVRRRVGPNRPLLLTAGGSGFFDQVVAALKPAVDADGAATLVLRSGAIFFHDHGIYDRALAALDARQGFRIDGEIVSARQRFRPALRIWAEVLSRPEPGLAIVGMGMRDVSSDQDLPTPLRLHRDGATVATPASWQVTRLNDQHGFLAVDGDARVGDGLVGDGQVGDVRVGDVVEFGISHPCTCLDRYRVIFGLDASGRVQAAYPTLFG